MYRWRLYQGTDIVIVKLNNDGNISWTKTIDSGNDDVITDMLQSPEGNYIIAGGNSVAGCNVGSHYQTTPTLLWLSASGNITDQRSYADGTPDGFIAIFPTLDGSYNVISQNGIIRKIDQSGNILWNRSAGQFGVVNYFVRNGHVDIITQNGIIWRLDSEGTIKWNRTFDIGYVQSAIVTSDNGYMVIGQKSEMVPFTKHQQQQGYVSFHQIENATAARISPNGTIIWEKSYGAVDGFISFSSIKELNKSRQFQVKANKKYNLVLNENGTIINTTLINQTRNEPVQDSSSITGCTDTTSCIQNNDSSFVFIKPNYTFENGFVINFHAGKVNYSGLPVWDRHIYTFQRKMGVGKTTLKKMIPTKDGGYIIAFETENLCSCSGCNVKKY